MAVDVRVKKLQKKYERKAMTVDKEYCGVVAREIGPVENKLISMSEVQVVVFGNLGETSEATHKLLDCIAQVILRVTGPQKSRKGILRQGRRRKLWL